MCIEAIIVICKSERLDDYIAHPKKSQRRVSVSEYALHHFSVKATRIQEFNTERKERSGKHYDLGLFIAKKVAERHNGALLLTNKDGRCGSAVTLIINRVENTHFKIKRKICWNMGMFFYPAFAERRIKGCFRKNGRRSNGSRRYLYLFQI